MSQNTSRDPSPTKPARILSCLFLAAASLCLIGRTLVRSPRQPMWLDEVFVHYQLLQDNFGDFWRSLHTNINATPPGYFLLMWGLGKIVPLGPLTLRLFSSVCSCGALVLVWAVLRRHWSFFVSTVGVGTVLLTSDLFLWHASEARYYGLYLLAIAWCAYNLDLLCTKEPTTRRLALNALSHAVAISVTYIAGLYCLAILLAFFLSDRFQNLWRPKVYWSVLLGWVPMFFYLPFFFAQRVAPTFSDKTPLSAVFDPFDPGMGMDRIYFVFAGLTVLLVLAGLRQPEPGPTARPGTWPLHLAVLAVMLLAMPYGIYALSVSGVAPVLVLDARYCLPSLIGLALLLGLICGAAENSLPSATSSKGHRGIKALESMVAALIVTGLVSFPLVSAIRPRQASAAVATVAPPAFVQDAPVVAACDPHTYFVRYYYSHEDPKLFFVVSKPADYQMYLRFQKRLNVMVVDDFLAKYPRFALVSDDPAREWLEAELHKRGGYVIEHELRSAHNKWLMVSRQ